MLYPGCNNGKVVPMRQHNSYTYLKQWEKVTIEKKKSK